MLANDIDPNGDPLIAVLHAAPVHGALFLSTNGGFNYAPAVGWTGLDRFAYRAQDAGTTSMVCWVTLAVTVQNVSFNALADEKSQSWLLEPVGNWSQFRDSTNIENRAHNIFNEITGINGDSTAVTHDAAGNMTSLRGRACLSGTADLNLKWDSWNRLTRLSDTSDITIATYTYDGDWKRLKKVVATNVTEYYYDDMQLAETRQIGATGQVTQTESLVYDTRYLHSVAYRDVYSGTLPATLVARHAFLNDGNFNVTALVATNGTVVERYTYDPYGKVTIRDANWQPITWDASQKNVCLYTGHKLDAETGLYYSLYRYYHPGLGRWTTRDPLLEVRENLGIRGVSGKDILERHAIGYGSRFSLKYTEDETVWVMDPTRLYSSSLGRFLSLDLLEKTGGLLLYGFCANNPVNVTDPYGLWSFYSWLYTGDGNASAAEYAAAVEGAADYIYNKGGVRGGIIGTGTTWKKPGKWNPAVAGGVSATWTIDNGLSSSIDVGVGFQQGGNVRVFPKPAGNAYVSDAIGASWSYTFYAEDCDQKGWSGTSIAGGQGNVYGGGGLSSDFDQMTIAVSYGYGYAGIVIDPARVAGDFRDSYNVIRSWFK